jgi:hypothetical protein
MSHLINNLVNSITYYYKGLFTRTIFFFLSNEQILLRDITWHRPIKDRINPNCVAQGRAVLHDKIFIVHVNTINVNMCLDN